LSTSLATKTAMLKDWGSWDSEFNALTARIRRRLVDLVDGGDDFACVPIQGSGTFAVEAAIGTLLPRDGKLLVLVNGAYGRRMARLTEAMGRAVGVLDFGDVDPVDEAAVELHLRAHPDISHVGLIHCETSTGILNPVEAVAAVVERAGRRLIIDAMSSFGALPLSAQALRFDAVIASPNKCLEGVPGMAFVLVREDALRHGEGRAHSLSLDLHDQWQYMEKTGQWRYTPPTHVVAAFAAALAQYDDEGGQPARLQRYRDNCAALIAGLVRLGLRPFLPAKVQAPIIVTVHAPVDPRWSFEQFYERVKARGIVLYPGKLTTAETFRVGCIGAVTPVDMDAATDAMAHALADMGLRP
jgi:2-aminoethylphosphonate-pyruvate transaminase